jgi:uncharacterized membrane protein
MTTPYRYDLLAVLALCGLQLTLVLSGTTGVLRIASGFLFVALLPGYSLLAAVYRPFRRDVAPLEHVILSLPVSLALDVALGLLLNNLGWSVRPQRQVIWMSVVTVLPACAVMYCQRPAHVDGDASRRETTRPAVRGWVRWPVWWCSAHRPGSSGVGEHALLTYGMAPLALIACLALALGVVTETIARPAPAQSVSLSLLDSGGQDAAYAVDATRGVTIQLQLSVALEGGARRSFELTSSRGTSREINLQPGQTWSQAVAVPVLRTGLQRLSWTLTGSGASRLRRSVHLWIRGR